MIILQISTGCKEASTGCKEADDNDDFHGSRQWQTFKMSNTWMVLSF